MNIPIKDRKLSSVTFSGLDTFPSETGELLVGGICHLSLTGNDESSGGPGINIFFAMPTDPDLTIRAAQHALLTRAREILSRLALCSVDEMLEKFAAGQRDKASSSTLQK